MTLLVNEEPVPAEWIEQEVERLAKLPMFSAIADEGERERRVRAMAESAVVDRTILRQIAEVDDRPIDPKEIEDGMGRFRQQTGCGARMNDDAVRAALEKQLRLHRTRKELIGDLPEPAEDVALAFYQAHKKQFRAEEKVEARHIVVNVNAARTEEEARAVIEKARRELDAGEDFSDVAERHSDCKDNGGSLGWFARGVMVEEFDRVVFHLKPGVRSPIFRTPFGFHIAEVLGEPVLQPCSFEMVKPDIDAWLKAQAEAERLNRALHYLRANSKIERIAEQPLSASA